MLKQAGVVWLRITVRYNSIVVLFLTLLFFICNHDRFGRWIAAPPLYPLAFGTAGQQQLSDTAAFGWRGSIYPFFCSLLFSSSLSLFLSHEEKKTTASRVQQRQRGISHATAADGREFDRGTGRVLKSNVLFSLLLLLLLSSFLWCLSVIAFTTQIHQKRECSPLNQQLVYCCHCTAPVGLLIFNKELCTVTYGVAAAQRRPGHTHTHKKKKKVLKCCLISIQPHTLGSNRSSAVRVAKSGIFFFFFFFLT